MSKRRGVADNEKVQRTLRQQEALRERQIDADLKTLMGDPAFRRFAFDFVDRVTGVFSATFTGNSQTFHLEGKRQAGIDLLTAIRRVAPDEWVLALEEENGRRRREELAENNAVKTAAEEDDDG